MAKNWYPIINKGVCIECGKCVDFCTHGVYDKSSKEKTYAMIQEFTKRFKERNKSIKCEDLLGTHMVTGDREKAAERVKEVCPKMVLDAAEILDELLER
jgi:Fe-S-cluster-containing hydrogenase component 2